MTEQKSMIPKDIDDLDARTIDLSSYRLPYDFRYEDFNYSIEVDQTETELQEGRYIPRNYHVWPLPDNVELPENPKERLVNMTLIYIDDPYIEGHYFALTGGGMDMSFSIARTYVRFGFLPPASLGDLPETENMDIWEMKQTVKAQNKSMQLLIDRYNYHIRDNDRLLSD